VHAQGIIQTVAGGGPNNIPALSAGLRSITAVAEDTAGNLYVVDPGFNRVFKVAQTGQITVVAGNGVRGYSGDGGLAVAAELSDPQSLAVDSAGNIFISDTLDDLDFVVRGVDSSTGSIRTVGDARNRTLAGTAAGLGLDTSGNVFVANARDTVYKIDLATGVTSVFAGTGSPGFSGDTGPASSAQLNSPTGVAVDKAGNVFIADMGNNRIREVQASTGDIVTVAGNGTPGFGGDGGAPTNASVGSPEAVFVDQLGNIFIAQDTKIREIAASTGLIETIAGTGTRGFSGDGGPATSAQLNGANGICVDKFENVLISDSGNQRIRKISASTGIISTIAGTGTSLDANGFPALDVSMSPYGIAFDSAGDVFIADPIDNAVREIVASTGKVQAVAGTGVAGYAGDGGPATSAELNAPTGVALDNSGNLFIAELGNQVVREVGASDGQIQTVSQSRPTVCRHIIVMLSFWPSMERLQ
jgi:hypothetical protein